jgi:hypothetical protein
VRAKQFGVTTMWGAKNVGGQKDAGLAKCWAGKVRFQKIGEAKEVAWQKCGGAGSWQANKVAGKQGGGTARLRASRLAG